MKDSNKNKGIETVEPVQSSTAKKPFIVDSSRSIHRWLLIACGVFVVGAIARTADADRRRRHSSSQRVRSSHRLKRYRQDRAWHDEAGRGRPVQSDAAQRLDRLAPTPRNTRPIADSESSPPSTRGWATATSMCHLRQARRPCARSKLQLSDFGRNRCA